MKFASDQFLAAPDWVHYLNGRLPDETPHTDDDFFVTDSSADYTEVEPSGTTTWTIDRGLVSAKYTTLDASDYNGYVKSITSAAAPMTIETRIRVLAVRTDHTMAGLIFSDGTTTGSNMFVAEIQSRSDVNAEIALQARSGTFAAITGNPSSSVIQGMDAGVYVRLAWKSSNTFRCNFSADGVSWTDHAFGDDSFTMTPTHFGFGVSTWGGTHTPIASFDYFRVYDSDLSV